MFSHPLLFSSNAQGKTFRKQKCAQGGTKTFKCAQETKTNFIKHKTVFENSKQTKPNNQEIKETDKNITKPPTLCAKQTRVKHTERKKHVKIAYKAQIIQNS